MFIRSSHDVAARHNLRCLTAPLSIQAFQIFVLPLERIASRKRRPFSRVNPPAQQTTGNHHRPTFASTDKRITCGISATKNMGEITAAIACGIAGRSIFSATSARNSKSSHPALLRFLPGNASAYREVRRKQFAHLIPFIEQAGITHFLCSSSGIAAPL